MDGSLKADQPLVAVDLLVLLVREGKLCLLLSERTEPPFAGKPALPGCFVRPEEAAEAAARRLTEEMLPVHDPFTEQLYTFTEPGRDPRGRVISVAYLVIPRRGELEDVLARGETRMVPYALSLKEGVLRLTGEDGGVLSGSDLAFDHGRIAETGLIRLQGKIDYTDIGFRFLNDPEAFSLSELQTVFEAVLETRLDSSNFRRAILGRYESRLRQTRQEERRGRGRPAVLYRFESGKVS